MRALYIIGNGLDIAHNLKTSYQDFYEYYLTLVSDDEDINAMKKDIGRHKYETWADLEIGLGKYTSKCANKQVFLKCLNDIKLNLRNYLKIESQKISQYKVDSYSDFISPGRFLDPEPRSRYYRFCQQRTLNVINVITLNYTSTLESLFGFGGFNMMLSKSVGLYKIMHIHGTLDDMMVMGVNDPTQISNVSFSTDLDVVDDFIKPEYNEACLNNKNVDAETLIQEADIIVLYGTSLGQSDNKWWKLIGERMELGNYPLLVYLPYDNKKNPRLAPNHLRRWTMQSVREIREKFDIKLDEKILASRICVAFNKSLFSVTKSEQKPSDNDVID